MYQDLYFNASLGFRNCTQTFCGLICIYCCTCFDSTTFSLFHSGWKRQPISTIIWSTNQKWVISTRPPDFCCLALPFQIRTLLVSWCLQWSYLGAPANTCNKLVATLSNPLKARPRYFHLIVVYFYSAKIKP